MIQAGGVRWLAVLPFLAVFSAPVQASRHDPIYVPEPIEVPAGVSAENIRRDVHKALFDAGFDARDIAPGHAEGKRVKSGVHGSYFAVVDVFFDSKTIRIAYKDSENLNYDARNNTIHSTYNKWVRNIERRLRRYLGAY
jgi:hypothetical protein